MLYSCVKNIIEMHCAPNTLSGQPTLTASELVQEDVHDHPKAPPKKIEGAANCTASERVQGELYDRPKPAPRKTKQAMNAIALEQEMAAFIDQSNTNIKTLNDAISRLDKAKTEALAQSKTLKKDIIARIEKIFASEDENIKEICQEKLEEYHQRADREEERMRSVNQQYQALAGKDGSCRLVSKEQFKTIHDQMLPEYSLVVGPMTLKLVIKETCDISNCVELMVKNLDVKTKWMDYEPVDIGAMGSMPPRDDKSLPALPTNAGNQNSRSDSSRPPVPLRMHSLDSATISNPSKSKILSSSISMEEKKVAHAPATWIANGIQAAIRSDPMFLRLVNHHLWSVHADGSFRIYNSHLSTDNRSMESKQWKAVFDVSSGPDKSSIWATDTGLYHLPRGALIGIKIAPVRYNSIAFASDKIYAYQHETRATIHAFGFERKTSHGVAKWNKLDPINLLRTTEGFLTMCATQDQLYVCSTTGGGTIEVINVHETKKIVVLGAKASGGVGTFLEPRLCCSLSDGRLLMADTVQDRLQAVSVDSDVSSWTVVDVHPATNSPVGAVVFENKLYVSSYSTRSIVCYRHCDEK